MSDGLERGAVHCREGENTRLGAAVAGLGDGVKLLLAGRVPEHQSHRVIVHPASQRSTLTRYTITLSAALGHGTPCVTEEYCERYTTTASVAPGHRTPCVTEEYCERYTTTASTAAPGHRTPCVTEEKHTHTLNQRATASIKTSDFIRQHIVSLTSYFH